MRDVACIICPTNAKSVKMPQLIGPHRNPIIIYTLPEISRKEEHRRRPDKPCSCGDFRKDVFP